jgi:hypothetical protein
MSNSISSATPPSANLLKLDEELKGFESRNTKASKLADKILKGLSILLAITGVIVATVTVSFTLGYPLFVASLAVFLIADKFFNPKKIRLDDDTFRELLSSEDPAAKALIARTGKACSTISQLYLVDPGYEVAKVRKALLQNVKSDLLKRELEEILKVDDGLFLPWNFCSILHTTVKITDKEFDNAKPSRKTEILNMLERDWKYILSKSEKKPNHKQILGNVATFLDNVPSISSVDLFNSLNSDIIKACAKAKVEKISISSFPWSEKIIKSLIAIPSLKGIIYNADIARPEVIKLLQNGFKLEREGYWERS